MKRILSLTLILILALTVSAQHQIATLKHNDSISVYYGREAFVLAHAAAVEGDIITLSSGWFTPPDTLNKAITIRGAGFTTNTLTGKEPTVINNTTVKMRVPGNDQHHLTLEGIRFSGDLECKETTSHAEFLRCYFHEIDYYNSISTDSITHSTFMNCIIREGSFIFNSNIVNCAVVSILNNSNNKSEYVKYNTFVNCVASAYYSVSVNDNFWHNCVLYSNSSQSSLTCYNCIGISSSSSNFFSSPVQHNCQNAGNRNTFSNIFKTFTWNGSLSELYVDETFELTDSVASLYLGNDGTQVGMHGGLFPFSSRVGDQRIGHITVAGQSNSEGKLPVVIEVVSE